MIFSSAFLMSSAFAALVTAGPPRVIRTTDASTLPYPLKEMTYSGILGDHEVVLNGSVQSIMAQAEAKFPGFNAKEYLASIEARSSTLEARNKNGLSCIPIAGQNWERALVGPITNGINYLNGLQGTCGVDGHSCSRISCSDDAAIYLCNDNDGGIQPACNYLGSYAKDIVDTCCPGCDPVSLADTGGQEFDSDKYNIIVRKDNC